MDALSAIAGWQVEPIASTKLVMFHGPAIDGPAAAELEQAIAASFPEYKVAPYFRRRPHTIRASDHLVVSWSRGDESVVGILVARWRAAIDFPYLHIEMNLITAGQQGRGLVVPLWPMWRTLLARLVGDQRGFPELLAIKTYNPAVYSGLLVVAQLTGASLYPPLTADGPSAADQARARAVADTVGTGLPFDPVTGVLRGAGDLPDFYPELPTTNRRAVQRYFEQNLEPGDRVLCLVRFGPGSNRAPLFRRLGLGLETQVGSCA